jgi:hypothetical protein
MNGNNAALIALVSALLSGLGTASLVAIKENFKENRRSREREQDHLKLDLKDLKIELYRVEKDLSEWKDKYYQAIQELIIIRAELEEALIQIAVIQHKED